MANFFQIVAASLTVIFFYSGHVFANSVKDHFLRPLRSESASLEEEDGGEYERSLRAGDSHFLRPLRAYANLGLSNEDLEVLNAMIQDQEWTKRGNSHFLRSLRNSHFLRPLRSPAESSHFLRSLRSPAEVSHFLRSLRGSGGEAGHFLRSLRGGNDHFLRALKSTNSHFLRTLRSNDDLDDGDLNGAKRSTSHFLRPL